MEKMHLCSVLNSLPLPAFSLSSEKWRSYIALLLNDFVTFKWKSLWEYFFIVVPARHSLVFIVHQNQVTGGHRIWIFS